MEMMAFIYSANISTIVSASRIFSVNKYVFASCYPLWSVFSVVLLIPAQMNQKVVNSLSIGK